MGVRADGAAAPNPRVVYRDIGEGAGGVLLHLDTGSYHGVNSLGSAIWHLLEEGLTPPQIVGELRRRIDPPPAELEVDVAAFLASLRSRDLLVG
jgi:Coenzyme PQQ synthesis protein D (PqqD)